MTAGGAIAVGGILPWVSAEAECKFTDHCPIVEF